MTSTATLCSWLEHGVFSKGFLHQGGSRHGSRRALAGERGGERLDEGLCCSRDLGVRLEDQRYSHLRACSRDIRERWQGHGLVHGGQHPHHALWVVMVVGMVVIVVMVMVLMSM